MMCLGWSNRTVCRDMQEDTVTGGTSSDSTPDVTWFWFGAAVAVIAGLSGRRQQAQKAA